MLRADSLGRLLSATARQPCLLGGCQRWELLGAPPLELPSVPPTAPKGLQGDAPRHGPPPRPTLRTLEAIHVYPLQDRFRSQQLPNWAAHLAADGGAAFCAALARGCALDAAADAAAAAAAATAAAVTAAAAAAAATAAATATATANGTRLAAAAAAAAFALSQPHRCARCLPPVDGRNAAAAAAARTVPAGGRCDGVGGRPAC